MKLAKQRYRTLRYTSVILGRSKDRTLYTAQPDTARYFDRIFDENGNVIAATCIPKMRAYYK